MPRPRKRSVSFEAMPRPAAAPTASHQAPFPVRATSAKARTANVQNITAGASGVAEMPPTPMRRVALIHRTASAPTSRSKRTLPAKYNATDVGMAERTVKKRTPNGFSPKRAAPAAIHQATMGG